MSGSTLSTRFWRTFILFAAMGMTGVAFDIGDNHPVQAAVIMWLGVFPTLYVRECWEDKR